MNRVIKIVVSIVLIIVADQITKWVIRSNFSVGESIAVIDGLFSITYVRNPGAAFGFMASAESLTRQILFLAIPVIACIWLVFLIYGTFKKNLILGSSYSLILAGAIGNLIDRFSFGYVVDFLDFYLGASHFPAFNIADSSITIGAGLLILDFVLQFKNKQENVEENG